MHKVFSPGGKNKKRQVYETSSIVSPWRMYSIALQRYDFLFRKNFMAFFRREIEGVLGSFRALSVNLDLQKYFKLQQ